MKIAILVRSLYPPRGAEESMKSLKKNLESDHTVHMFGFVNSKMDDADIPQNTIVKETPHFSTSPFPLEAFNFLTEDYRMAFRFKNEVQDFNPDVILAQHELIYLAFWMKYKHDTPIAFFIRDMTNLGTPDYDDRVFANFFKYIESKIRWRINRIVYNSADTIIANSHYSANMYSERYENIAPFIIYPFVDTDEYMTQCSGEKILHIIPQMNKGIDITLKIAKKLPSEEFLIVGHCDSPEIKSWMERLPNVDYVGYLDNMREAYSETKLVLQPSRWEEAFGRIPIEAGVSGIPTLCSGTGGSAEAVGYHEFTVESNDPSDYVKRINRIFEDYDKYSTIAEENAQNKSESEQLQKARKILSSEFGI